MRRPSGPSTTIARAWRRSWTPYELTRRVESVVGSTPWSPMKLQRLLWTFALSSQDDAYWPADAPTCQLASTTPTPARSWPAKAGAAAQQATSTPNTTIVAAVIPLRISPPGNRPALLPARPWMVNDRGADFYREVAVARPTARLPKAARPDIRPRRTLGIVGATALPLQVRPRPVA